MIEADTRADLLSVREASPADLPEIRALMDAADVHRAFGWQEPPGVLDSTVLVRASPPGATWFDRSWLLCITAAGAAPAGIGLCSAHGDEVRSVQLAYALAAPARGMRRMAAFLRLVLPALFAAAPIELVRASVAAENIASRRSLEAAGFVRCRSDDPASLPLTFALRRRACAGNRVVETIGICDSLVQR
jgi:RimJ/RimL family protein N-acetyltransferase